MWDHFDEAFASMDKAFGAADAMFARPPVAPVRAEISGHQLRFSAGTLRERWRMTSKFARMSLRMLFTGRTTFAFKSKTLDKQ